MKVRLLTVSNRQPGWVVDACAEYRKRLPRAWRFEIVEVKPEARGAGSEAARVRAAEARRLRAAIPKGALVVALDERGAQDSTERFAERLAAWQQRGRDLVFAIGGADGFDPEFLAGAELRLALSRMTMPHGMVRVVFVEQLYRAFTLLEGHPYHK